MQKSKKSLYIALGALLLVGILTLVLLMRDYAILINAKNFDHLMQTQHAPKEAWINKQYLYFIQKNQTYKVFKEGISEENLGKLKIKVREDYTPFVLIFLIVLLLAIALVSRKKIQKQENSTSLSNKQETQEVVQQASYPHVTFEDVAGIAQVKEELLELVDFLKDPKKYRDLDIVVPKGVLLIGPPGVGKTLIAKAMATESGVPFFYQSGSSFVQIYAGMGAKKVRELFSVAKKHAPSIIFIDEIDAVGKSRGGNRSDEREATLNELLTQMDGFDESSGVVVIGASNVVEVLDEALLRSGRFDRKVFLELPSFEDRCKILSVHLRAKKFDFEIQEVAKICVGFNGAALALLINEAALHALKDQREILNMQDILAIKDKVFLGTKIPLHFDTFQKEILSIYQAAKAFSAHYLNLEFEKCLLMGELLLFGEKSILSQKDLQDHICFYLSGILALEIFKGQKFTLGEKDLQEANKIAQKMYAYDMLKDVQEELNRLKKLHRNFLEQHQEKIQKLAALLLQKEKITHQDIHEL